MSATLDFVFRLGVLFGLPLHVAWIIVAAHLERLDVIDRPARTWPCGLVRRGTWVLSLKCILGSRRALYSTFRIPDYRGRLGRHWRDMHRRCPNLVVMLGRRRASGVGRRT